MLRSRGGTEDELRESTMHLDLERLTDKAKDRHHTVLDGSVMARGLNGMKVISIYDQSWMWHIFTVALANTFHVQQKRRGPKINP